MAKLKPAKVGGFTLVRVGTPGSLYCGRNQRGQISARVGEYGWLGNPHPVGIRCPACGKLHKNAAETLPPYYEYLHIILDTNREFAVAFDKTLAENKLLACYCKDDDCHTRIMAEVWHERNGGVG